MSHAYRSSWGVLLATGDVSLVFLLLVIAAAGLGIYFLVKREWVGAVVAAVVAILLAVFLL